MMCKISDNNLFSQCYNKTILLELQTVLLTVTKPSVQRVPSGALFLCNNYDNNLFSW